jgi:integrase/recombinase XerD
MPHHLDTAGNHPGKGGRWEDPQSLLFLSARFLEHLRIRHYSPRTVYRLDRHLSYFRKYCEALTLTQARQVTRAVILSYQSYLFHYKKPDGAPLSVGTQNQWLVSLVQFFSYLTREGLILYNPASDIDRPRKEKRLPKALLSAEEVQTILASIDTREPEGIRDRAIVETLYSTGIRRMELCNLDLAHVDLAQGLLRVFQGKGRKDRVVPIGARAVEWVEKYLADVRPALCPSLHQPALFLTNWATRYTESHLTKIVRQIIRSAGIAKPGSCHLFRHAFATGLLQNGCDVRHIQIMLGHASLETTQIYTHLAIADLQEAHRRYHPTSCPPKPAEADAENARRGDTATETPATWPPDAAETPAEPSPDTPPTFPPLRPSSVSS